MSASNITALAGAIGQLLTRESSDAAQLADLASVLRILREAVRDEQALERIDWLLADLTHFTKVRAQAEALEQYQYHEAMRRARV